MSEFNIIELEQQVRKDLAACAEFLDAQWLASFGLKRVARKGPACGKEPREAHPVGNTGVTSKPLPAPVGGLISLASGVSHG